MNMRIIAVLALAVLVAGCGGIEPKKEVVRPITDVGGQLQVQWADMELTNVQNQRTFTLAEYQQPVLVNLFTTWCSTCIEQQELLEEADVAYVGLSVDPQDQLESYVQNNDLSAPYALVDEAFSNKLIDEFGTGVLNPLSQNVILLCPDGDSTLLGSGIKDVSTLESVVESC